MKTVVVASNNPVKLRAVRDGFERMFPGESFEVSGITVPSGVREQPLTDDETRTGSLQRARNARVFTPEADFWAGVEGGVQDDGDKTWGFAWVTILGRYQAQGSARTGIFQLPARVRELVKQGKELGEADDIVFGRSNSKQEEGAVGLLTQGVIDRAAFYEQAVVLALIPLKNPALYTLGDDPGL